MGKKTYTAKKTFLLSGALLAAAGLAFLGWSHFFAPAEKPQSLLSTLNLPSGAVLSASLETRERFNDLSVQDDKVAMPAQMTAPYRLNASVRLLHDQYRDFRFTVADNRLSVVTDGFHAGDVVFLDLNERTVFSRVPSDWSGKLELETALPPEQIVQACVRIAGKNESFGLCHTLPERRAL